MFLSRTHNIRCQFLLDDQVDAVVQVLGMFYDSTALSFTAEGVILTLG